MPIDANGKTPRTTVSNSFAICAAVKCTWPIVSPHSSSRPKMMTPNAMAVSSFASRYAAGGMGLACFSSSQPCARSFAMVLHSPKSDDPTRPKTLYVASR